MCTAAKNEELSTDVIMDVHKSLLEKRTSCATVQDAERIFADHYGITAQAKMVSGERDDNFLLSDGKESWFLKIVNEHEPSDVTDSQIKVLQYLSDHISNLPTAKIVENNNGDLVTHVDIHDTARSAYAETTIDGVPATRDILDTSLRKTMGQTLATLENAMSTFEHIALHRQNLWNICDLGSLLPLAASIQNKRIGETLSEKIRWFTASVKPALEKMPVQAIHNDFSADNIYVDPQTKTVSGIVDFGDMVRAPTIVDVASACAYQLGSPGNLHSLFTPVNAFLKGYLDVRNLSHKERKLLPDLLIARMVVRLTVTEWRATRFPDNAEYILRNNQLTWRQFNLLTQTPKQNIREFLNL